MVTGLCSLIFTLCEVYTFYSVVTSWFHVSNIMRGGYDIIFHIFLFILCAFFALYSVTVVITLCTIVLSSCVGLQYYVCVATILCLCGYNIMFVGLQYYVCGATILCLWGYNIMFSGLALCWVVLFGVIIMFMMVTSSNSGKHV